MDGQDPSAAGSLSHEQIGSTQMQGSSGDLLHLQRERAQRQAASSVGFRSVGAIEREFGDRDKVKSL